MTAVRSDLPGIGSRLREARVLAGLSQAQAADLVGMHRPSLTQIENEKRRVTAGEAVKFAEIYKVSLDWLLTGETAGSAEVALAARGLLRLKPSDQELLRKLIATLGSEEETKGQ